MRINKYLAAHTALSRRGADTAVAEDRVTINNQLAKNGDSVDENDVVTLDGKQVTSQASRQTILFNKPVGYVCSRNGQGSRTIYDLLPAEFHSLNPVGRLDKESSGLLLLTNDGDLANELTHPRYGKTKVYEVRLNKPLEPLHQQMINDIGVQLEDGPSRLMLEKQNDTATRWRVSMQEGRNRQIRRTFAALGYTVTQLHRTHFGPYNLAELGIGELKVVDA
jgi:pseudouridine synthase